MARRQHRSSSPARKFDISPDLELTGVNLTSTDESFDTHSKIDIFKLFRLLLAIPRKQIHSHHDRAIALSLLTHFALKLIGQGAVLPEISEHIRRPPHPLGSGAYQPEGARDVRCDLRAFAR